MLAVEGLTVSANSQRETPADALLNSEDSVCWIKRLRSLAGPVMLAGGMTSHCDQSIALSWRAA